MTAGTPFPQGVLVDQHDSPVTFESEATLFVFFKSSCATSRLALPVYDQWRRFPLPVVAVSQDPPEVAERFRSDVGLEMPTVFDPPPFRASAALGLTAVPTVVLAEAGTVIWSGEGWSRAAAAELTSRLAARFGGDPTLTGVDHLPRSKPG